MNTAIVLGTGLGYINDLKQASEIIPKADIVAVNFAALTYPGTIKHLVSAHNKIINSLSNIRSEFTGIERNWITHGTNKDDHPGIDHAWDAQPIWNTLSGGLGAYVAHRMGYKRIFLAGIPADSNGYFWGQLWDTQYHADAMDGWRKIKDDWGSNIRSFSGATMELFGHPFA